LRIAFFYHSLLSDWNHGNAHFLRGVVWELGARGHEVRVFEPERAWSLENLLREAPDALLRFERAYPALTSRPYDPAQLDLDAALDGIDLVLVHEWNDPQLVARIGRHRAKNKNYKLLFHDTHHRSFSEQASLAAYDLSHYDGVLAFGAVIRERYLERGWAQRAWVWHEAADVRVFRPADREKVGDLIWIGNWGDDERTAELHEFLFEPAATLSLRTRIHGVRYPRHATEQLAGMGIRYLGWIANFEVPAAFAAHRVTVHVPRRPYLESLHGVPTIRPFEALACGRPLVMARWGDAEHLFRPGTDYLVAQNGAEMRRHLRDILNDRPFAAALAAHGRETILARHTCAHRVNELLAVYRELDTARPANTGRASG
jgi:spore maturation protein CgeB